jgi:hypothetical protein
MKRDNLTVNTITIMMMEVPCCEGLLQMVKIAFGNVTRIVKVNKIIVSINGEVLQKEWI